MLSHSKKVAENNPGIQFNDLKMPAFIWLYQNHVVHFNQ